MSLVALVGAMGRSAAVITACLALYTFLVSAHAPILESLVSTGVDARTLSRRVGLYNLIWAGIGALTVGVDGFMIERWPLGVFIIPMVAHAIASMLIVFSNLDSEASVQSFTANGQECPRELLQVRTLALWLSRISLPATYVIIFGMLAMMPTLPIMQTLKPSAQTLLGCVWMVARFAMFIVLGATVGWHTKPRLLLVASFVLLASFLGAVNRPADLCPALSVSLPVQLLWMIAAQVALGAALGIIYSGSLYFGMVLSHGSAEHGGYHEALIGVGSCLGPGSAAFVEYLAPNTPRYCIGAISGVMALTVIAATIAAVAAARAPSSRRHR